MNDVDGRTTSKLHVVVVAVATSFNRAALAVVAVYSLMEPTALHASVDKLTSPAHGVAVRASPLSDVAAREEIRPPRRKNQFGFP